MKQFFSKKYLFFVFFFLLSFISSCSTQDATVLTGTWFSKATYMNELASQENPSEHIAEVHIVQENKFIFLPNGQYTRVIKEYFSDAISFSQDISEESLVELYGGINNEIVLNGFWTLEKHSLLHLVTETATTALGGTVDYDTFFAQYSSFGEKDFTTKIKVQSNDKIVLQGIPLSRIEE